MGVSRQKAHRSFTQAMPRASVRRRGATLTGSKRRPRVATNWTLERGKTTDAESGLISAG